MENQDQERQEKARRGHDYLPTAAHRLYIGKAGVTIINTDRMEDPEGPDPSGDLLVLSPVEAVQMAREVLAHAGELEVREPELEEQYEQVSQVLLRMFLEQWEPGKRIIVWFNPIDFEKQLHDAFVRETLSSIHLEHSKEALEVELEENVPNTGNAHVTDCFYEIEATKVILPDGTDEVDEPYPEYLPPRLFEQSGDYNEFQKGE